MWKTAHACCNCNQKIVSIVCVDRYRHKISFSLFLYLLIYRKDENMQPFPGSYSANYVLFLCLTSGTLNPAVMSSPEAIFDVGKYISACLKSLEYLFI